MATKDPYKKLAYWEKEIRQLKFRMKHKRIDRLVFNLKVNEALERIEEAKEMIKALEVKGE